MPLDHEEKTFTKEDLDLVKGEDTSDDSGGDDKAAAAESSEDDSAKAESKDTASEKEAASGDGSIFDDIDEEGDDDSKVEDKTDKSKDKKDKESKSEDKSEDNADKSEDKKEDKKEEKKEEDKTGDWREKFIDRALQKQKGKLTAEKFDKRREALKKELSRYSSQEDYMIAGLSAREKLRSGEYRRAKLPDDATEEEVAKWREDNNIPAEAKAYDIPKIAGHNWADVDVPFIDSFKEAAHKANMTQQQMDAAARWYAATLVEQQNEYAESIAATDKEDRETARDALRSELGNVDYKTSLVLLERLIKDDDVLPGNMGKLLMGARYNDENGVSRRLINNPDVVRHFIDLARDTYGDAAIVTGDGIVAGNNRKKEIEDLMNTDINEYYRRGWDKELLEINQKEEARSRRRSARA